VTYYIESAVTDPAYNLALEQYIFDYLDRAHSYFMLWQNNNSVIIGKHQNTIAEINASFINSHNVNVVRRLSGGGAVYHDLGNINFTFITDTDNNNKIDFFFFCSVIQKALVSFGVRSEISGRNDITIEGKKVSGNAQYTRDGRVMHHGTLLYDCNLDMLRGALNISDDITGSKGIKSVKSEVGNIRCFMSEDASINNFLAALKKYMFEELDLTNYNLHPDDISEIEEIKTMRYCQWSWNYGSSPPFNIRKSRRFDYCGKIDALLNIGKEGIIEGISFYGDFFGAGDPCELAEILKGSRFEYSETAGILKDIDLTRFFHNITPLDFLALLYK